MKKPRRAIWKAHIEVSLAPAVYEAIYILALVIGSSTTIYATGLWEGDSLPAKFFMVGANGLNTQQSPILCRIKS